MTDLRQQANDRAQAAFRRLVRHRIATGEWDRHLLAEYNLAEQELDRIDSAAYDAAEAAAWSLSVITGEYVDVPLADPGDHFAGMS